MHSTQSIHRSSVIIVFCSGYGLGGEGMVCAFKSPLMNGRAQEELQHESLSAVSTGEWNWSGKHGGGDWASEGGSGHSRKDDFIASLKG